MAANIKVAVRVRPFNEREKDKGAICCVGKCVECCISLICSCFFISFQMVAVNKISVAFTPESVTWEGATYN
jgi:hypothetical protein